MRPTRIMLIMTVLLAIQSCKDPEPDWAEAVVGKYTGKVSGDNSYAATLLVTKVNGKVIDITLTNTNSNNVYIFEDIAMETETSFSKSGVTSYWYSSSGPSITTRAAGSVGGANIVFAMTASSGGYKDTFVGNR